MSNIAKKKFFKQWNKEDSLRSTISWRRPHLKKSVLLRHSPSSHLKSNFEYLYDFKTTILSKVIFNLGLSGLQFRLESK